MKIAKCISNALIATVFSAIIYGVTAFRMAGNDIVSKVDIAFGSCFAVLCLEGIAAGIWWMAHSMEAK